MMVVQKILFYQLPRVKAVNLLRYFMAMQAFIIKFELKIFSLSPRLFLPSYQMNKKSQILFINSILK